MEASGPSRELYHVVSRLSTHPSSNNRGPGRFLRNSMRSFEHALADGEGEGGAGDAILVAAVHDNLAPVAHHHHLL
eukprot:502620-Pyramimonas_sp.AAC.1